MDWRYSEEEPLYCTHRRVERSLSIVSNISSPSCKTNPTIDGTSEGNILSFGTACSYTMQNGPRCGNREPQLVVPSLLPRSPHRRIAVLLTLLAGRIGVPRLPRPSLREVLPRLISPDQLLYSLRTQRSRERRG